MRTKLTLALVGLLAVGGTAVGVSGGAQAQSGSRLCGVVYRASTTKEVFVKLYEYPQRDKIICVGPTDPGQNPAWDQAFVKEKDPANWSRHDFQNEVCENFPKDFMNGKDFRRVGDRWPSWEDHHDVCNNMNRSDTIFELERYYAYDNGGSDVWDFIRD